MDKKGGGYMIKIKNDLTNTIIGDFIVVNREEDYTYPNGRVTTQWRIKHNVCTCGKEFVVKLQYLKNNNITCECMKPKCRYDLSGEYGIGYTSKNEPFLFDLEDYDKIKNFYWWYDNSGYLQTLTHGIHIRLHRLVMGVTDPSIIIDHIQHAVGREHKIDNRKSNLRIVTRSQNNMNSGIPTNNTSGTTGVHWDSTKCRWKAEICVNYNQICLGYFVSKADAIKSRQKAEEKYFKEFSFNKNNKMEEYNNG